MNTFSFLLGTWHVFSGYCDGDANRRYPFYCRRSPFALPFEPTVPHQSRQQPRKMWCGMKRRYFVGIVFILLCASLWAGSSVLIQYIYSDLSFNSPFLLTYLATSLLVLHLPYYYGMKWVKDRYYHESNSNNIAHQIHQDYSLHDDPEVEDSRSLVDSPSTFVHVQATANTRIATVNNRQHQHFNNERTTSISSSSNATRKEYASDYEVLKLALIIAPMWFLANCLYNYSLLMTTVSSSTVISNLSASFTLLFSSLLNLEKASYVKIIGVIICFVGAITTGLADSGSTDDHINVADSLSGDVIAVLGAAGYGLYTTAIRYLVPEDESDSDNLPIPSEMTYFKNSSTGNVNKYISRIVPSEDNDYGDFKADNGDNDNETHNDENYNAVTNVLHRTLPSSTDQQEREDINNNGSFIKTEETKTISMHLLLGYIGLVNALLLAPVLGIMFAVRWSGVAGITGTAVGFVCANGMADTVIADYFWARAVLLTSPTVATIGMSVTIPIALVTDYLVYGISPQGISIFGALLVVVGFVLVNVTNEQVWWLITTMKEKFYGSHS